MRRGLLKLSILAIAILGLPLLGVIFFDKPLMRYLEFPPKSRYVTHAPFSWAVFGLFWAFLIAILGPFIWQAWVAKKSPLHKPAPPKHPFPRWGWLGLGLLALFWTLAWTRFEWFAPLQEHTFFPLWFSYILTINAFTTYRRGSCVMKRTPLRFLLLFPYSALFWWLFEYLNRFVQNWFYILPREYTPLEYFFFASLSFSTVLPAVASSAELARSFFPGATRFSDAWKIDFGAKPRLMWLSLAFSCAALFVIGSIPNALYPFLWISPFVVYFSLEIIMEKKSIFPETSKGDWSNVISWALAALVCGFFWEMWNYHSLSKWVYKTPYVERFRIFEMPLLGYFGYLTFGLECAAAIHLYGGEDLVRSIRNSPT